MNSTLLLFHIRFFNYYWMLFQLAFIIIVLIIIKKYNISGQKVAFVGFVGLFIMMIFSLLGLDDVAGKIAECVWILFVIAFMQQFVGVLRRGKK